MLTIHGSSTVADALMGHRVDVSVVFLIARFGHRLDETWRCLAAVSDKAKSGKLECFLLLMCQSGGKCFGATSGNKPCSNLEREHGSATEWWGLSTVSLLALMESAGEEASLGLAFTVPLLVSQTSLPLKRHCLLKKLLKDWLCTKLHVEISLTIYRGHLGLSARSQKKVSKSVPGASRPQGPKKSETIKTNCFSSFSQGF